VTRVPTGIADATLLAVHEHGLERLTFDCVAQHAGVPVSQVEVLTDSPASLASAAMAQSYEDWRDQAPAWLPIPEGGSLAEGLTEILRDTFRHLADPGFLSVGHLLMLQPHPEEDGEGVPDAAHPRKVFLELREQAEHEFTAWFRHAIERDPTIRPQEQGTDRMCARLVLLAIDGFVTGHRLDGDTDPDAYRAMLVDVVVSALRA
jgi:hypothetical protein